MTLIGWTPTSDAMDAKRVLDEALSELEDPTPCHVAPEAWFESTAPDWVIESCLACTVASECLIYALSAQEAYGTWGGLDERERKRRARARKGISNGRAGEPAA